MTRNLGYRRAAAWLAAFALAAALPAAPALAKLGPPVKVKLLGAPAPAEAGKAWTGQLEITTALPVQLTIHDAAGRRVNTLVDGVMPAGSHARVWDGRDLAGRPQLPGVYYYRLRSAEQDVVGRLTLLR